MGKETELKRIKSEWDKLNLEEIDHETSKIADLLLAKAGGKVIPPSGASRFYDTLTDIFVMTLAELQEKTGNIDEYSDNWDKFTDRLATILDDWDNQE
jgi:hypothetical protein